MLSSKTILTRHGLTYLKMDSSKDNTHHINLILDWEELIGTIYIFSSTCQNVVQEINNSLLVAGKK